MTEKEELEKEMHKRIEELHKTDSIMSFLQILAFGLFMAASVWALFEQNLLLAIYLMLIAVFLRVDMLQKNEMKCIGLLERASDIIENFVRMHEDILKKAKQEYEKNHQTNK
jgi:hypothetical protein